MKLLESVKILLLETKEALSLRVRMNQKVTKIILSISYPSFCKKSSFGSH